jgi:hypothetical protein
MIRRALFSRIAIVVSWPSARRLIGNVYAPVFGSADSFALQEVARFVCLKRWQVQPIGYEGTAIALRLHFRSPSDAVAFRLRYADDLDFIGRDSWRP